MSATAVYGLPWPEPDESNDYSQDMQDLAKAVEGRLRALVETQTPVSNVFTSLSAGNQPVSLFGVSWGTWCELPGKRIHLQAQLFVQTSSGGGVRAYFGPATGDPAVPIPVPFVPPSRTFVRAGRWTAYGENGGLTVNAGSGELIYSRTEKVFFFADGAGAIIPSMSFAAGTTVEVDLLYRKAT